MMYNEEKQIKQDYYIETIKPTNKAKGLKKFVVGLLVASIVGGGSIGASFAVVNNLMNKQEVANAEVQTAYQPPESSRDRKSVA